MRPLVATLAVVFGTALGGDFFAATAADLPETFFFATFEEADLTTLRTLETFAPAFDFDFAFAVTNFNTPEATC